MLSFRNLYSLLSKFRHGTKPSEESAEEVHRSIQLVHGEFGLLRFQLGVLLLAVKQQELWRGKAQSFAGYLEEEKIKLSAASQYMKVAEKLILELKLTEEQLTSLSRTSMTTLVKACDRINASNQDELISQLETLSDRDVKYVLDNYEANNTPLHHKQNEDQKVKRLKADFFSMPNDLRIDFMRQITSQSHQQRSPSKAP